MAIEVDFDNVVLMSGLQQVAIKVIQLAERDAGGSNLRDADWQDHAIWCCDSGGLDLWADLLGLDPVVVREHVQKAYYNADLAKNVRKSA